MSNKLKKTSQGYADAKKDLRERITKEGGVNITPEFMREYTELEDKTKAITENEFFDILAGLSDEGFKLYKISQICKGKEERGMMACTPNTVVAFAQNPSIDISEKDKE